MPQSRRSTIDEGSYFLLSTVSPSAAHNRLAALVACGIVIVFLAITVWPLRGVQPGRVDAFIPAFVTAMFVFDVLTAVLLYAQFAIIRSLPTLIVASAYLFAALVMVPFALVFPGVFLPGKGLVGGTQSTSFIYFFQHGGFPAFIIGYALLNDGAARLARQGAVRSTIALSVIATSAVVLVGALVFIIGEPLLPRVTLDALRFSPKWWYPAALVAVLNLAAIAVLWRRRRAALDIWLMVVVFLYAVEIPLSYYPDPQRFSLGWYVVRLFGVMASSIVLLLLIQEVMTLYARLLTAADARRREREARLLTGDAVAASMAHEFRQPLSAMVTTADAGLRFLDRPTPNVAKAKEAFERISADGHRAGALVASIRASLKGDDTDRTLIDVSEVIRDVLEASRGGLQTHAITSEVQQENALPQVLANRIQLEQVLMNLVSNAIDAMANQDHPRVLRVRCDNEQDRDVTVSVADTGRGFAAGDASQLFNPLFTTKTNGMGMGLAICRSIVEAHHGRLWCEPNNPRGAVFHFTLRVA